MNDSNADQKKGLLKGPIDLSRRNKNGAGVRPTSKKKKFGAII